MTEAAAAVAAAGWIVTVQMIVVGVGAVMRGTVEGWRVTKGDDDSFDGYTVMGDGGEVVSWIMIGEVVYTQAHYAT